MKDKNKNLFVALVVLALFNFQFSTASAQGTTGFTYQGQLRDNGTNANGAYTMIFKLYDSPDGANLIGGPITTSTTMANGLFTVNLDFGASAFNGSARYLDITVTNGGGTQELSPRVQVLPSPYALYAALAAEVTNGAITSAQLAANAVATTNIQSGAIMNAQLAPNAVMDANIVSVSGGKVSGLVASATNAVLAANAVSLATAVNDWTVQSATIGGYSDGLAFSHNGTVIAGLLWNTPDAPGFTVLGGMVVNDTATFGADVDVTGSVSASVFDQTSDRNLKMDFAPVNSIEVLNGVANLPISTWHYKNSPSDRHIGPMAQDFYAAFRVGTDDRHITTIDEGGIALAAIQGLNQKLDEKNVEIEKLESQNESLERRLTELESLIKSQNNKPGRGNP